MTATATTQKVSAPVTIDVSELLSTKKTADNTKKAAFLARQAWNQALIQLKLSGPPSTRDIVVSTRTNPAKPPPPPSKAAASTTEVTPASLPALAQTCIAAEVANEAAQAAYQKALADKQAAEKAAGL
jgi:hypothetical protein